MKIVYFLLMFFLFGASDCDKKESLKKSNAIYNKDLKSAYFASGCFWCVEAIFESVTGVHEVISGYSGGTKESATYDQVSSGYTDHAESVKILYDPKLIDYKTLLLVFFDSHDPTTLHRQGPDAGRQYRSAIFYENNEEEKLALNYIQDLESTKYKQGDITTEVSQLIAFYEAEDYHQNYEKNNPHNSYVRAVSVPRLKKFQALHPELLKDGKH